MSRAALHEALRTAREFSQARGTLPAGGRFGRIKRLEHVATQPVLRRQRIFNGAVVSVLDKVARSTEEAGDLLSGHVEFTAHHEAVAELRRDLVALQQEVAHLTAIVEKAGLSAA